MRRLGPFLLPALAIVGAVLTGCGSTLPYEGIEIPSGETGLEITARSQAVGIDDVRIDSALITTQRRMLGLALYDQASGPDVRAIAPRSWFIGVTFRYDGPGPELRQAVQDADETIRRDACRVRVVHSDAEGRLTSQKVVGGALSVEKWVEDNGLVIRMDGVIVVELDGDRRISARFQAPVQGWYLAP